MGPGFRTVRAVLPSAVRGSSFPGCVSRRRRPERHGHGAARHSELTTTRRLSKPRRRPRPRLRAGLLRRKSGVGRAGRLRQEREEEPEQALPSPRAYNRHAQILPFRLFLHTRRTVVPYPEEPDGTPRAPIPNPECKALPAWPPFLEFPARGQEENP